MKNCLRVEHAMPTGFDFIEEQCKKTPVDGTDAITYTKMIMYKHLFITTASVRHGLRHTLQRQQKESAE